MSGWSGWPATANERPPRNGPIFLHFKPLKTLSETKSWVLLEVLDAQEKQVEYGLKSLPYLKKAYSLKPKNRETINGLSAIYYMLQEKEKHQFYQNLLNQLVDEPEQD